jgi:uncharacterized membrane protein YraQ (UPF0718 family)
MNEKFKEAIIKSGKGLGKMLPVIAGVILLIGLVNTLIPKSFYTELFGGNFFLDPLIGSVLGSILAGNPITSYVLGGELLNQGITLIAVTAFIVSWVTVGIVQLPAESMILGKKFAVTRNILSFVFAIVVAIITVGILNVI